MQIYGYYIYKLYLWILYLRAIQKTAEETVDLIGDKIADKITSISKSPQNPSKKLHSETDENEIEKPKERLISPEKRQQIIDELRLAQ